MADWGGWQGVRKGAGASWRGSWRRLPQKGELESMASTNPLYDTQGKQDLKESGLIPALEGTSSISPLMGEVDIEDAFELLPTLSRLRTPSQILEPAQPDCGPPHTWDHGTSQERPSAILIDSGCGRLSAIRQPGVNSSGVGAFDIPHLPSAGAWLPGGPTPPGTSLFDAEQFKTKADSAAPEREKRPRGAHVPDGEVARRKTVTFCAAAADSTTAEKGMGLSFGVRQGDSSASEQCVDVELAGKAEPLPDAQSSSPGDDWKTSDFHTPFVSANAHSFVNLAPHSFVEGTVKRGSLPLLSTDPALLAPSSRAPLVTRYTVSGAGPFPGQLNTVAATLPLKVEAAGRGEEAAIAPPAHRQSMATAISELKVQSRRLSLLSAAQTFSDPATASLGKTVTGQVAGAANDGTSTGLPKGSSTGVPRLQLDRLLQEPTGASTRGEQRPQLDAPPSSWRPAAASLASLAVLHGDSKVRDAACDTSVSPRDREQSTVGSGSSPCNWLEGSGPSCSDLSPDHAVVCPDLGSESDNADAQHCPRTSAGIVSKRSMDERQGSGGVLATLRGRGASWAPTHYQKAAPMQHERRGTNFAGSTQDVRALEGPGPVKQPLLPPALPVANPSPHFFAHQEEPPFPSSPLPSGPQNLRQRSTGVGLGDLAGLRKPPGAPGEGRSVDDDAPQNLVRSLSGTPSTQQQPPPSPITLESATWDRGPGFSGGNNVLAHAEPSHFGVTNPTFQLEAPPRRSYALPSHLGPRSTVYTSGADTTAGVSDGQALIGSPAPISRASLASRDAGGLLRNTTYLRPSEYTSRESRGAEALRQVSLQPISPNDTVGEDIVPQSLPYFHSGTASTVPQGTALRPQMSLPASGAKPRGIPAAGFPRLPLERDRSVDLVALRKMGLLGAAKGEDAQAQGRTSVTAGQAVHMGGKVRELGRLKSGLGSSGGILASYKSAIELGCLEETGGNPIPNIVSRTPPPQLT